MFQPVSALRRHGEDSADAHRVIVVFIGLQDHVRQIVVTRVGQRFQHTASHPNVLIGVVIGGQQGRLDPLRCAGVDLVELAQQHVTAQRQRCRRLHLQVGVALEPAHQGGDQPHIFLFPQPFDSLCPHARVGIVHQPAVDGGKAGIYVIFGEFQQSRHHLAASIGRQLFPGGAKMAQVFGAQVGQEVQPDAEQGLI